MIDGMRVVDKLFRKTCYCCDVVREERSWVGMEEKGAEQLPGTGWGETARKREPRGSPRWL
jgi:hypothetical protein